MFRKHHSELEGESYLSNKALLLLILPLVAEQFLAVMVGIADTVMVSGVGESAVAAISLVDNINLFVIQLFTAMSAGGAIVASQYLGSKDKKNACAAAHQLLLFTTLLSTTLALILLIFHRQILGLMDDGSDAQLFEQACTYLIITVCSYPFLSIYSAGISLMRAMGNTKTSMWTSALINVINVCGNLILIHPCGMGVAGAATATLLSRITAALVILRLMFQQHQPIHFLSPHRPGFFRMDIAMIKRIFRLGVPSGVENSLFQFGRLLIAGLVATFPTAIRAAHGIANSVSTFAYLPNTAIGLAAVSVIGHLIGADRKEEAKRYGKKLFSWMYISLLPTNLILCFFSEPIIRLFNLSEAGVPAASEVLFLFGLFSLLIYAPSFGLPNIMRAAGDARYTMLISLPSMLILRLALSYLLVYAFHLSLLGVWLAMFMDWVVRALFFYLRFRSNKWLDKKAI